MTNWDILVLDKSASMISCKKQLIDGFNDLVKEQKSENSKNLFTVITFNNEVEIFTEDTFPNVQEIKDADIILKGSTALLDAIGKVYDMILDNKKYTDITITVITDGFENSSEDYTIDMLDAKKQIIDKMFKVKMVFIGADISCINNNEVNRHATQSVNCSGDIHEALRIASRTMSSQRDNNDYVPNGIVEYSAARPLVMKRSLSAAQDSPPKIKRCKTFCTP